MNATDFLASKGIKVEQVAEQLGCTHQNVRSWITGSSTASITSVERLTNALNALGANTNYTEVFNALWQTRQERKGK
jgi:transcriptional regulator with XRE-family HTH domain